MKKIPRKYVLRMYDLKGSTHSRQVLKNMENVERQVNQTMKDVDFARLETKLWLNTHERLRVWETIQADSRFLLTQGLIDYSLIVIKIDIAKLKEEN